MEYLDNVEGRALHNTHLELIRQSRDTNLLAVQVRDRPLPQIILAFHNDAAGSSDLEIQRIYARHGVGVGGAPTPQNFVQTLLQSEEGRRALAASVVEPLRRRLDYQGIGRRAFVVDAIPEPEVAPPPPKPCPLWVMPGVWAYNARQDEHVQVLEVTCPFPGVKVQVWRSVEPARWVDVDFFYENWTACPEPEEPRSWWSRLEEDSF